MTVARQKRKISFEMGYNVTRVISFKITKIQHMEKIMMVIISAGEIFEGLRRLILP